MTELELVYKVITTSGRGKINGSDRLSERVIRSMLLEHRSNLQLNFTANGKKIPQTLTQDINVEVTYDADAKKWIGDMPDLLDLGKNRSLVYVHDYSNQLSVNYAKTEQQSLFDNTSVKKYKTLPTIGFNHRTNKLELAIDTSDTTRVGRLKEVAGSSIINIDGVDVYEDYKLYIVAVLFTPQDAENFGSSYNWKTDRFPISQTLELPLMESVRKEYNNYVITEE